MDSGKLEIALRGSKPPLILKLLLCVKEQRVDGYSSCIRCAIAHLEYLLNNRGQIHDVRCTLIAKETRRYVLSLYLNGLNYLINYKITRQKSINKWWIFCFKCYIKQIFLFTLYLAIFISSFSCCSLDSTSYPRFR